MSPSRRVLSLAAFVLTVTCATGAAQVVEPPPRVFQPRDDSDRLRQELGVELDTLGSYDDNLAPEGGGTGQGFEPRPSGYTGLGSTALRYWVGRTERSFEARGGAFVNSYRNIGLTPSYGGDLALRARTNLGRRTNLDVAQSARSDPYFGLGAFGTLASGPPGFDAGVPDSSAINALSKSRSLALDTRASLGREWTRQTTTDLTYSFNERTYEDGAAFDSRRHLGSLFYDRSVGRSSGFEASYRYSDLDSVDAEGEHLPIEDQTLELGFRHGRDVSRTRRIEISGGAGAVYIDTLDSLTRRPRQYVAPSGYGSIHVDLGRTWTVATDYRRSVSVPQGRTPQAFLTDAGSISVGGFFADRVAGVFTGTYSNGQAGQSLDLLEPGRFDTYQATAQLRFPIAYWWSAVVSYSHYQYRLNTVASLSLGIPPERHRNTVSMGVSLRVPVVGPRFGRADRARNGATEP